jgi:hypothetical protein
MTLAASSVISLMICGVGTGKEELKYALTVRMVTMWAVGMEWEAEVVVGVEVMPMGAPWVAGRVARKRVREGSKNLIFFLPCRSMRWVKVPGLDCLGEYGNTTLAGLKSGWLRRSLRGVMVRWILDVGV